MPEKEVKSNSLQSKLDEITKKHGLGSVMSGNELINIERISTGSLGLDIITGGGWGVGKIVEVYGPESSGKTTVSIHGMVEAQKAFPNKRVAIIDAEHALDRNYCKSLGLDMSKVIISQPDNGEQGIDIAIALMESGEISFLLIDSVAALIPKAELEGEMTNSAMGSQARLMSKACRMLTGLANKTGTIVYFTNQLRDKIGVMFGNPEITTGGNALKFYASIRIDIRKKQGEKDKESDEVKDIVVTCKTVKNKLAPPFRKCVFNIEFGKGIDKASEILEIGLHVGLIKRSGSHYSYKDTKIGNGVAAAKTMLNDNPQLMEEIEGIIRSQIDTIDAEEIVNTEL
jgi:recombination protein RecA